MKKKFRFRLEVVQNLRKREEDFALKRLAEAQKKFQGWVEKRQDLMRTLEANLEKRENLALSVQISHSFQLHNDFILGCKVRIFQTDQAIGRARKVVEKALREYLQAKRKTRALELMRENAFRDYKKEALKREQKEMEEIYTFRGFREVESEEDQAPEFTERSA